MHFLTLTWSAHIHGAHSRHKEMARALVKAGHRVSWMGPDPTDMGDLDGVEFLQLPGARLLPIPWIGRIVSLVWAALHLRRTRFRADLAFVAGEIELGALAGWPGLGPAGPPVVFLERSDLATVAGTTARLARSPLRRLRNQARATLARWRHRRTFANLSGMIVQTTHRAAKIRRDYPNLADRVSVLPNAVGATWMEADEGPLPAWLESGNQKLIGFVARLVWEVKGIGPLLAAFQLIRESCDARLVLIGDGPDEDRARREVEERGLSAHVVFAGLVPNASALIRHLDLLLVPSQVDTCPNVVLEGLAAGVPVVASDIEAHRFQLGERFDLPAADDPAALARATCRLIDDESARAAHLAAQAERLELWSFDWSAALVAVLTGEESGRWVEPLSAISPEQAPSAGTGPRG